MQLQEFSMVLLLVLCALILMAALIECCFVFNETKSKPRSSPPLDYETINQQQIHLRLVNALKEKRQEQERDLAILGASSTEDLHLALRQARKDLFAKFNNNDTDKQYQSEFLKLTEAYERLKRFV